MNGYELLHGDTWESPPWAIAMAGNPINPADWVVKAQVRRDTEDPTPLHTWTADTIRYGTATVRLKDGTEIVTGTIQLLLTPADWVSLPRKWFGYLDIELASDSTATPTARYTVVRARPFRIVPDIAR